MSQATWNSCGLLTSNINTYQRKSAKGAKLANRHDVGMFQEIHGDGSAAAIFYDLLDDHTIYTSFNRICHTQGGLMITLSCAFVRRISEQLNDKHHWAYVLDNSEKVELVPGRLLMVTLKWRGGFVLRILNLHIAPQWNVGRKIDLLQKLRNNILDPEAGLTIIGVDFNFGIEELDRASLLNVLRFQEAETCTRYWERHFGDLVEHFQENFTRADTLQHPNPTAARIDRIYSTHNRLTLAQRCVHRVCTWGLAIRERYGESDHTPVSSIITEESSNPLPRVPKWIEKDPLFSEFIETNCADLDHNLEPFTRLERIKDAIFAAAHDVREHRGTVSCSHAEGHIHFAFCALRGLEHRNQSWICKACKGS